jgi:hypothetical protein
MCTFDYQGFISVTKVLLFDFSLSLCKVITNAAMNEKYPKQVLHTTLKHVFYHQSKKTTNETLEVEVN